MKRLGLLLGMLCTLSAICGCNPLTVHKVTSTIFDGVPSLPPADQFCQDYHEQKVAEEKDVKLKATVTTAAAAGSSHKPYKEKRCDDCHDRSKESGLMKPKEQLCFMCHKTIIAKSMIHGPAAVGACLDCHEPHSSNNPSLLKVERDKVCAGCHKEKRLASEMHDKVTAAGMACADCHDPHAGDARYFLR